MFRTLKTNLFTGMVAITIIYGAIPANAINIEYNYPVAPELQRASRSITFMNSGKGELVVNKTHVTCSTDLDCLSKGNNLYKVNQFNRSDFTKNSSYPLLPVDQRIKRETNYWADK